ncbi:MAG: hypothetical protein IPM21_16230 [Acidobacteria bacterium]|nr:hypothetical protein [Acidobacteriota bacterium]
MFLVYAKGLAGGSQLYVDLWDVKQPGIFYFYEFAGRIFGFSEIGIHFFELLYWIVFSAALIWITDEQFENDWLRYLMPLTTVGYYYATAGSLQMTQVETLVGFPLFLSFAFIPRTCDSVGSLTWMIGIFVSGLAIASALMLKFAFLPLLGLLTLAAITTTVWKSSRLTLSGAALSLLSIWSVAAAIIALFLVKYWYDGILDEIIYSTFQYPQQAVAAHAGAERLSTLANSVVWFALTFAPLILLTSVFGLLTTIRRFRTQGNETRGGKTKATRDVRSIYTWCFCVWLVVGLFVLIMQATSWWAYHFMLFVVPLGFLALRGMDEMILLIDSRHWAHRRTAAAIFTVATVITISIFNVFTVRAVKSSLMPRDFGYENGLVGPIGDSWEVYRKVIDQSRAAGLQSGGSDIWACAEPHYYYLNDKIPPISSNGWMPEFFVEGQWRKLEEEITKSRPENLVLYPFCLELIRKNTPTTYELIVREYDLVLNSENVLWYRATTR